MSHRAKDYCQASSSGNLPWTDFFFFFSALGILVMKSKQPFFFFSPHKLEKQWVLLVEVTWSFFFYIVCCMACWELGKILTHISMEQMKQLSWSLDRESFVNFSNVIWWWGGKSGTHWICGYIFTYTHIYAELKQLSDIWQITHL